MILPRTSKLLQGSIMPIITRETFISEDHVRRALTLPTMTRSRNDGQGIEQVPIPKSAKARGVLPKGYSVDFLFDPALLVSTLKDQGITEVDQLPEGVLEELKENINAAENLAIVQTEIYEGKREITEEAIANPPDLEEDGKDEDLGPNVRGVKRVMRLVEQRSSE